MSEGPLRAAGVAVLVDVQAAPAARRDAVAGLHGGRVRVRTSAPPADGRANARVAEMLADLFGVPKRDVTLVSGMTSRKKTFAVAGLALADAERKLAAALAAEDAGS